MYMHLRSSSIAQKWEDETSENGHVPELVAEPPTVLCSYLK